MEEISKKADKAAEEFCGILCELDPEWGDGVKESCEKKVGKIFKDAVKAKVVGDSNKEEPSNGTEVGEEPNPESQEKSLFA